MATSALSIQFGDDLGDEDRAGAQRAVEGMAEVLQRQADELAAVRAERAAALAAVVGDAPPAAGDGAELREAVQRMREGLAAARGDARTQPAVAFDVRLHPGLTVTSPPYDGEWHWQAPGVRNPMVSIADRHSGAMHIRGQSATGDERTDVACGVGMRVRSDVHAIVQVRPYITYQWRYVNHTLNAIGAFAESEGGVNLGAWLGDGTCVSGLASAGCVRSVRVFRDRVSAGEFHENVGSDTVLASDIQIEFTADPGVTVFVNAGAWVRADHAAGFGIGDAEAFGQVDARMGFVVIERFPSG
jgi:hypothetical protein